MTRPRMSKSWFVSGTKPGKLRLRRLKWTALLAAAQKKAVDDAKLAAAQKKLTRTQNWRPLERKLQRTRNWLKRKLKRTRNWRPRKKAEEQFRTARIAAVKTSSGRLAFHPKGHILATSDRFVMTEFWSVPECKRLGWASGGVFAFSPSAKFVAVGGGINGGGESGLWSVDGKQLTDLARPDKWPLMPSAPMVSSWRPEDSARTSPYGR